MKGNNNDGDDESALKTILGWSLVKRKSDRFYMSHGRLRFGKKRPSEAAESTTLRSDRGRTDNANHGVERRAREMKEKRAVSELCSSGCPDFPLAGP